MRYFTIGMAGHIDHGKTTLTKALTKINTDRLKEEQERNISIELGYAPLYLNDDWHVSMIDVPGHEKFIRQMIAGVAGIDLVIVAVAADEGMMPQTKEHLEILSLLGIEEAIIAITKSDTVDNEQIELASYEIHDYLEQTPFSQAEIIPVDSMTMHGLTELKTSMIQKLATMHKKKSTDSLRLPIDQVFALQGYGTIVRGTIYNGIIEEGQSITILPHHYVTRVRQLQSQNKKVKKAYTGQRVAINLANINHHQLKRGDVLANPDEYTVTTCIDVVIHTTSLMTHTVKQREQIKLHVGTSEVMGHIVFFDRNTLDIISDQEIYCQLRLDEAIVVKKGDSIILRRPSPTETFAGGKILRTQGEAYPFGQKTIRALKQLATGSPLDQFISFIQTEQQLIISDAVKQLGMSEQTVNFLLQKGIETGDIQPIGDQFTLKTIESDMQTAIVTKLETIHQLFPLKYGIQKEELRQELSEQYPFPLINALLDHLQKEGLIIFQGPFVALKAFQPAFPNQWETRMNNIIQQLKKQGLEPTPIQELIKKSAIPAALSNDFLNFIMTEKMVEKLDDKHVIHTQVVTDFSHKLKQAFPQSFTLQEARTILNTSRKYLVPFLELLDKKKSTRRQDNKRLWILRS